MTQFDYPPDWPKPVVLKMPSTFFLPVESSAKSNISWILHDDASPAKEAFSENQVEYLCQRYDIEEDRTWELSRQVARTLYRGLRQFQPEHIASRQRKAIAEVKEVVALVEAAEHKMAEAQKILSSIYFGDLNPTQEAPQQSVEHEAILNTASETLDHLKRHIVHMAVSHRAILKNNPDKRRYRDIRRETICRYAFELWQEHGRNVGYTSDPVTSERSGKVVELVNDIVSFMTEPATRLSPETIKAEIEKFKAGGKNPKVY